MWIEDLGNYIRNQNVPGIGQNVFLYTLKENDMGAMLTSHNTGILSSNDIPDYYKGQLQIIVRSRTPKDSQTQAVAITNLLDSNTQRKLGLASELALNSVKFNYIFARHFPVIYPRSDGDFYEASINFDVCFVALS